MLFFLGAFIVWCNYRADEEFDRVLRQVDGSFDGVGDLKCDGDDVEVRMTFTTLLLLLEETTELVLFHQG
jgi:hypothetical protein